jgi:type II secretory pathway component PulF
MTYVVPQIKNLVKVFDLTKKQKVFPSLSQLVMGISSFLTQWGFVLLIVLLVILLLLLYTLK